MKATVKQKQQNSIEYDERGIGYSQVYKKQPLWEAICFTQTIKGRP